MAWLVQSTPHDSGAREQGRSYFVKIGHRGKWRPLVRMTEAESLDTRPSPGGGWPTGDQVWSMRWSGERGEERPIRAGIEYTLDWAIGYRISNNYSVPISHISILYDHYSSIIVHLFALACSNSVKNDLGMFVFSPLRAALLDCLRAFTQPSLKTNPGPRFQLC